MMISKSLATDDLLLKARWAFDFFATGPEALGGDGFFTGVEDGAFRFVELAGLDSVVVEVEPGRRCSFFEEGDFATSFGPAGRSSSFACLVALLSVGI